MEVENVLLEDHCQQLKWDTDFFIFLNYRDHWFIYSKDIICCPHLF